MSLTVNLCVREREQFVNYRTTSLKIVDNIEKCFPMKQLEKEVKLLSKTEKKKYKKIAASLATTVIGFLALTSKSMAQATTTPLQQEGIMGLPTDFIQPMTTLLILALGVAFILTIGLMMAAGVMRMFRQRKFANEWTEDILRGFTQILLSIPVIFVIYYVAVKMLKVSEVFISPL